MGRMRENLKKFPQKMKAAADAGNPDGIGHYEAYFAKHRKDYRKRTKVRRKIQYERVKSENPRRQHGVCAGGHYYVPDFKLSEKLFL